MVSKKILIPDINSYSQFRPFLDDFVKRNKERNKNFSFRYLAKKLGWSASHLNDVLQGRRFLSLNKVLELIEFLGLKGVRAERLLLLALFESNSIEAKGKDYLEIPNSSLNIQTMSHDEAKLLSSIRLQQVFHYIVAHKGVWNISDFISRSRKPQEISKTELSEIIQILEQKEIIRWNKEKTKYIIERIDFYKDSASTDEAFTLGQKEYAKTYLDFLEDRYPSWTDLFGEVLIPRDHLPEVFDRIAGLRNYLYEIRSQALAKNPDTQFEVFQFSISLFSVFRREKELKK